MSDLWVYKRRQSTLARHKHGGFNASFPMNGHTILHQMALNAELRQIEESRKTDPAPSEIRNNVLNFPEPRGRISRTPSLRGGKRPGGGNPRERE